MLMMLTNVYADGTTKPLVLNEAAIKEIEPDDREGSASKAVIWMLDTKRRYWVAESVEEIAGQLRGGK